MLETALLVYVLGAVWTSGYIVGLKPDDPRWVIPLAIALWPLLWPANKGADMYRRRKRAKALEAREWRDNLEATNNILRNQQLEMMFLRQERDALLEALKEARDSLSFYTDEANWKEQGSGSPNDWGHYEIVEVPCLEDAGDIAQQGLDAANEAIANVEGKDG